MRRRHWAAAAAASLIAGCNSTPSPVQPPAAPGPAIAVVRIDTPSTCRIELDGRTFIVPRDGERLFGAVAALRGRVDGIALNAPMDIPYRCIGGLIYAAQHAGIPFAFAAEPPQPDPAAQE
jgi:hypothetical protein